MASTTFVDNSSVIYASWLNNVNEAVYNGNFQATTITPTNIVCNGSVSGTGFSGLVNNTLTSPGAIGNGTPNTGAFTTLTLTNALGVSYGGTGTTTSTGSGATVRATSPTLATPTLTSPTISGAVVSSMASSVLTSGTVQNSTSGTSIDFTGIPAWAKRITVMLNGVSTNGTSVVQVQLGSGSPTTTGYLTGATLITGTSANSASYTSGFGTYSNAATDTRIGHMIITNISGNIWICSGIINISGSTNTIQLSGNVTLSGTLDRVRITTVNGTDTFDAGSINIMYE